ncbi:MAG: hypothetical protein V3V99_02045 [candidate division Zixibacteria bacterium]
MDRKKYCIASGTVFGLVAILHLVRAILGWPFQVGDWMVPIWISYVGFMAAGFLSIWAFRQLNK